MLEPKSKAGNGGRSGVRGEWRDRHPL